MAIVTISHQMGAGGTEIGTALAQRMGYHYVDHELLEDAVRRGATAGVLRGLRERKIDVVVGTQMLAKGHDFPGVRLVGVVNADIGTSAPVAACT